MVGNDNIELYDLSSDIGEKNNIAPENPEIVTQLIVDYEKWEDEVTKNYE